MEIITSNKNEKIKRLASLLKSKKNRDEQGVFVIEGIRLFKDTLKTASKYIESVFISEGFQNRSADSSSEEASILSSTSSLLSNNINIYCIKDSVFEVISGTVSSQGIMAIVRKPVYTLNNILGPGSDGGNSVSPNMTDPGSRKRYLVLENIQDPGNLGTMLRTAEAAGMNGIIMSGDCTDIFSPKVVRSSMGSIFRMPFVYCEDFLAGINEIKEKGVTVYAAYLHGGVSYKDIIFENNYAILIGNEGNGLTEQAVNAADKRIFIPMQGEIESLNAAIAAAILMYK